MAPKPANKTGSKSASGPGKRPGIKSGSGDNPAVVREVVGPQSFLFFEDAGPDARVRLYREDDLSKKWIYHGLLAADEATEQLVVDLFGGGRWVVQLIGVDPESGKQRIQGTRSTKIPGPYRPPRGELPGNKVVTVPVAAISEGPVRGGERVPVNDVLNTVLVDRVLDVVQRSQRGQESGPPAWIEPMLRLLAPVIERVLDRPQQRDDPERTRILDELRDLRRDVAERDRPGPAASGIADAVEAVKSLIGVKDLLEGRDPNPDAAMWNGFGKLAEAALRSVPGTPALPAPGPVETREPMPLWQQLLVRNKGYLLDAAMRGDDAADVADLAARLLPANVVGVAVEFVQQPNALDLTGQAIPELLQFPAWTQTFLGAFRAILLEPTVGDVSKPTS